MWKKKLPRYHRGKESQTQISNPLLIETTYDERNLADYPHVNSLRETDGPQATSPYAKQSDLPFRSLAPESNNIYAKHISYAPTVSSVYSQPTPQMPYAWNENQMMTSPHAAQNAHPLEPQPQHGNEPDISPPSSPGPPDKSDSRPVSPIDPNPSRSMIPAKISPRHASQIPVRKPTSAAVNKFAQAVAAMKGEKSEESAETKRNTRWDEYSGEPSLSGKPPQVIPGTVAFVENPVADARSRLRSSEQRLSKLIPAPARPAVKDLTVDTKPREGWRGASGRTTIVEPLIDRPDIKPLYRPPKDNRESPANSPTPTSTRKYIGGAKSPSSSSPAAPVSAPDPNIKPIVPLKVGRNSPSRIISSPASPNFPKQTSYASPESVVREQTPSPIQQSSPSPVQQSPATASWNPTSGRVPSTPPDDQPTPKHAPQQSTDSTSTLAPSHRGNDPRSRFSWTTYATNTTYQQSPPPSPPPPMPTELASLSIRERRLPPDPISPSILDRTRPVARAMPSSPASSYPPSPISPNMVASTTRKPVGPRLPVNVSGRSRHPSGSASIYTIASTGKALPAPPPQQPTNSADVVASLQEQLEMLAQRRRNLQRVVGELRKQKGAIANPLLTDMRKVRETEARAKELDDEIAGLKAEEYEIGLRLHRAWKRREKEEGAEAGTTALWIRRVTG